MPIFEYVCEQCAHAFERIVLSGGESDVACPQCRSAQVRKIMSPASFRPNGIPTGSGGFKPPACKTGSGGG